MDKTTGFRAFMILVAAFVLFALIALYRNQKSDSGSHTSRTPMMRENYYEDDEEPTKTYGNKIAETFKAAPAVNKVPKTPTYSSVPGPPAASAAVLPSEPTNNEQYRAVDFGNTNSAPSNAFPSRKVTTADLLPKDAANTLFAQLTPSGQGELSNMNFMNAGWHIGVNTQGQSLRNANQQLRSDPVNPQYKVSPWNMSTVEPDVSRRPFEIS